MRVLLINPYYPISETPSPPLGLACLAAALESADIDVKILDFVVFPYSKKHLEKELQQFDPHMLGVTAVTMSVDSALKVVQDAKSIAPEVLTVMGGPHVTFCARETMRAYEAIDFIVLGEGEETIVELTNAVQKGKALDNIKGLAYRQECHIKTTEPRPFIKDIDSLPQPARHLIPLGRYRALGLPVSITTSRGCPFQCIFCVGRKMVGANVRYRSPQKIVDELEMLGHLDFQQVNLADDLFTASKRHCMAVCDEMIQRKLKIQWTSFARVDTVSPEMLKRMKEAGCTAVSFGVESGSPEILKRIKKGITIDQVFAAVKMCNHAGITPQASFILGLPGETPETLQETVELGGRLKQMGVLHGYHLLAPFPGTDVLENLSAYDLQIMSHDWKDYHANRAIVRTATVSQKMMDDIVIDWEHQFNLWLDDIKQRREKGETAESEAWPLTKLEHTVLLYELMMNNVIEDKGVFKHNAVPTTKTAAVKLLVDQIEGAIDQTRRQMILTLSFALDRGYLSYTNRNGFCRWKWTDYL
jgi:anaerobic magnesium-protoporphyrin IX monomethyl ester cyclase